MNETNVKVSFNNSVTNAKKLDKYAQQLKEIYSVLSAIDKGQLAQLGEFNVTLTKVKDNTQKIDKNTSKFAKNMNSAFSIGKILIFGKAMGRLISGMNNLVQKSANYTENINLLEVAYANINRKTGEFNEDIKVTSARIEKLINNMSEVYGLDESDLARQFGIFKQLANAMELPTQTAENLSEIMVKMRQDIASLYNLDLERAGNALQSALAGQVRPIRTATGADITEKTLQKTVDNLGLDTTINKLSFVEKRLIMVISLTDQLKNSQGDYGRTIESIANQTKVLHDQWERLTRAIGNVFNPLMRSILPVVNGVLMALTEIANIIASLLGFKLDEFDYSGLAGISDTTQDIIDGMDGAGASVDKLKKKLGGLRSFDKLNVITTPSDSGKSSGGGVSGGINPKILEAFNSAFSNYDDMLGKVRMKANDIRDSIMEWLGFTKEINPLTGEIEWKYEGIGKTFSNIWQSIKNLSPDMKILVAGIGVLIAGKTISALGSIVSKFQLLTGWTNSAGETLKGLNKTNIQYWKDNATWTQKFTTALIGAGGLVMGFTLISAGMDEINEKGLTLKGTFELLGGTMSNVFGGAMIGSIFGPWGTAIGAFGGLIISLIEGWSNYKSEAEKVAEEQIKGLEPLKNYNDELQRQFDIIDESGKNQSVTVGLHQSLFDELQKITDENGRVQTGYEKRAEFIITELNKAYGLEIEMVDGVIKEYDKQKDKIQELIDQKRIEIATEIAGEKYKIAIQQETEAYENLRKAKQENETATQRLREFDEQLEKTWKENEADLKKYHGSFEDFKKSMQNTKGYKALQDAEKETQKVLDESKKSYKETQKAILIYNNVVTSAYEGNIEEVEYWKTKLLAEYDEEKDIYTKMANEAETSFKTRLEESGKALEESNESEKALYEEKYNILVNTLQKEVDAIYDNEDDYVNAWMVVGLHSKDMFLDGIKDLPEDVQDKLIKKMNLMENVGEEISDNIQNGINKNTPSVNINFKAKTSAIRDNLVSALQKMTSVAGSAMSLLGFDNTIIKALRSIKLATGGMPQVGQLFIANEKGPELVGNIGGQSFVANQNQMMDLLDRKIGNAQNNSKPQVINLYLDADHKIGSYTIEQLQNMAKTDGKPITIGG